MDSNRFRDQIIALLPRLRRFAFSLTSNLDDADDLVQAACERALSKEYQWRPGTRLDSWLLKITHNLWIDGKRSVRQSKIHIPIEEGIKGQEEMRQESGIEAKIMFQQVMEAMEKLPENDRVILSLICVDGMSYKEASATLDIPVGTIMSRLARARKKLHALMNENDKPLTNTNLS